MIITSQFGHSTNDPQLIALHETRTKPSLARCIKDRPEGTYLKRHPFRVGDVVTVQGLVGRADGGFEVCIPAHLGFYDATAFELLKEEE